MSATFRSRAPRRDGVRPNCPHARGTGLKSTLAAPAALTLATLVTVTAAPEVPLGPMTIALTAKGKIANAEQAMQFLRPVVEGHQRSVFAMTEPDGAGSATRKCSFTGCSACAAKPEPRSGPAGR